MTILTMPSDLQTEPAADLTTAPVTEAQPTNEQSADDPLAALDAEPVAADEEPAGTSLAADDEPTDADDVPLAQVRLLVDLVEEATNVNIPKGTILAPAHFDESDAACVIVEGSTYEDGELWIESDEYEMVDDTPAEATSEDASPEPPTAEQPAKTPLSTEEMLLKWKEDINRVTCRVEIAAAEVERCKEESKAAKKELELAYDQLHQICKRDPLQRSLFAASIATAPKPADDIDTEEPDETETDDEPTDDPGQTEAADADGETAPFCESSVDPPTADDWRAATLASVGLTAKQCEKLAEEGVVNMGQLADWQNNGGQLGDIKGFGEKAIDKMQSLFDAFWDQRNKQAG
ncbi:hypothetical protein [Blastopirellula retiformator]|uniref:RNA polymerase alpha subunit C-terminal domain-containing protein n=1 Tax=Blastopirellula retiformator TaxID=2527970 RepID=A0A5C5UWX5_9BACT|nr:hypothetical protein [Blastopirellula retiformator]TWT30688.1 hypothetical protein Enr8_42110 [Blastopirellula retiformator]